MRRRRAGERESQREKEGRNRQSELWAELHELVTLLLAVRYDHRGTISH